MKDSFQDWCCAAGIRAVRTFAQALAGYISAYTLLGSVDWLAAFSCAALAAIYSLCMSASGLPELERESDE